MESPDFSQFPQPETNDVDSVDSAIKVLRHAHDQQSADKAYDGFLWAMVNNHAGTFYPVVLAALPQIKQILNDGGPWSQRAAMETLIDLGGSFIPEPGHELYLGASVRETLRAFIHSLRPRVALLAQGTSVPSQSAGDLLELIDDQAT